ncbi:MAG: NAD(P)/FAD-dependent oxidoreductase [Hyphomicrobiales bacterium]
MSKGDRDQSHYDVVIVGASFAGLVCARTAAMRGLKVCVLEAKADPGARMHTTGILVKEAADEVDLPHTLMRRVHGVRLYAPSLSSIDLFAPGSYFLTTRTADIVRWLAQEATRAGATIMCGARFSGAERDGERIRIGSHGLRARYLVGADGARSSVAECFGLGRNTRFLTGIEAEYDQLAGVDPRFLHCFIDAATAPGYIGWIAPGPDVMQVGLAVKKGRKPDLGGFLARTGGLFDYDRATVVEKRSGRIPCGGLVHPLAAPGVILIGDAAGLVSPMTGGGIRLAFRFGRRAAQAISDHLLDCGPSPERVLAREYPKFRLKKLLRAGLDLTPPNPLVDFGISSALMRKLATRIYFHRSGAAGESFRDFERRIRDRVPGATRPAPWP